MPAFRSSPVFALALASLWLALSPTRAVAGLVLTVESSTTPVGGVGSFDVLLSNTGATSFQVAFFSVELSVPTASGVKFTAANTSTTMASYIFGTLQSPPFSFDNFPNTSFTVSDSPQSAPGFVTLTAGEVVGLEHVTYSVAAGTPTGPIIVSIDDIGGGTALSDLSGALVPFTPTNGTITVTLASVPEPSSLVLLATALIGTTTVVRARRGRLAR
jgi:PEP-CTERM motif